MKACRKAITETLLALARGDKRIFAVATDSRGSVTLGDFAKALPGQFVECGIAEQDAVGISAGLANAGLKPFVCGPASFYATRAAEQIKVDVAYSGMNVKIIGVSGGVSYGALGGTHHAVQDVALMRAIPGLQVFLPSDSALSASLIRALAASDAPAYVRVGRGDVPDVYAGEAPFEIGKANLIMDGTRAAILATGEMVYRALEAGQLLSKDGVSVKVYDMSSIKPIDVNAILDAARTGAIVTVEEHSIYGGLGGAVAEIACQQCPVKMRILGLPDETLYSGTAQEVFSHYGLTAAGIARTVKELIA